VDRETKKATRLSLAGVTGIACVVAMAVGMALWGIGQILLAPGAEPLSVFVAHASHVVLLGAAIYLVVVVVFRRLVFEPIRRVNRHLYGVATGHVAPLDLSTSVSEVADLVRGVDLMVERMRQASPLTEEVAMQLAALRGTEAELRGCGLEPLADRVAQHIAWLDATMALKGRRGEAS